MTDVSVLDLLETPWRALLQNSHIYKNICLQNIYLNKILQLRQLHFNLAEEN